MPVRTKILALALEKKSFITKDATYVTKKSRQYISKIINELVEEGELVKIGSTRNAHYIDKKKAAGLNFIFEKSYKNVDLEEHVVLAEVKNHFPAFKQLPENVQSIFDYSFSEMFNNAIDHSTSQEISVIVSRMPGKIRCIIKDYGIGVFLNVMKNSGLNSELEAMQELLKGKLTTQPKAHSGEGIFFTSKACDKFTLNSFKYQMKIDNVLPDIFFGEPTKQHQGTEVIFDIKDDHKKHLSDIFESFYFDPKEPVFDKTTIHIQLYTLGTVHISRSQAKRVLNRAKKFKLLILDFEKVSTIGQAFADEIFRIFKIKNPQISITAINTNKAVQFMIDRVEKLQYGAATGI